MAQVDDDGNIIETDKGHMISTSPPHGLYRLRWTGTEWVEGATQEEIDEIINSQPTLPTPAKFDVIQRLADVELMLAEMITL